MQVDPVLSERLERCDFVPVTCPGQDDDFLAKTLKAAGMPRWIDDVVDNENVCPTDSIAAEVCADKTVQIVVQDSDYYLDPASVISEEGCSRLADAKSPSHNSASAAPHAYGIAGVCKVRKMTLQ